MTQLQFLGGEKAQGMEAWNPETGEVTTIASKLPQESVSTGFGHFQLISLNYQTELVFIGGYNYGAKTQIADVWLFKYPINSWNKVGQLSASFIQHSSFLVSNLRCP